MFDGRILVFGSQGERSGRLALAETRSELLRVAAPEIAGPPDPRAWHRAVSELALFNWLLLPTVAATEAVLEAIGAAPGTMLRIATVGRASEPLGELGREPELAADDLRSTLGLMADHLGRRQRVLVPHGAGGGRRVGSWLEELGAEAVCCAAYGLHLDVASPSFLPSDTAWISTPEEADSLATHMRCGRLPAELPTVASTAAARDAAEDLGLEVTLAAEGGMVPPLDTLLDESPHDH